MTYIELRVVDWSQQEDNTQGSNETRPSVQGSSTYITACHNKVFKYVIRISNACIHI